MLTIGQLVLLSIFTPVSSLVAYAVSSGSEASCADIQPSKERLACFEYLTRCGEKKEKARLVCFDNSYSHWVELRGSEPELAPRSVVNEAPPAPVQDSFGAKPKRVRAKMSASISSVQVGDRRIDYLTLDNGQIWRETTDSRIHFKEGQEVTIESGILGSHSMHIEGVRRLVKVKRVK